jgi:hypothetical protein
MSAFMRIIPLGLYFVVGVVCLIMAFKNMQASQFLPFHQQAAGRKWEDVDRSLQFVILALMRVAGLGFLATALLLIIFPIVNFMKPNPFVTYAVPGIVFLYCLGLFVTNYILYHHTKTKTPWKGSLYALFLILAGLVISIL